MKKFLWMFALVSALGVRTGYAADYDVDKAHTSIGFSVKHMVISSVKGHFGDFSGGFSFDEKTKSITKVFAAIKATSINTDDAKRDEHLRSPDFLDVANFPEITFNLKKAQASKGGIRVTGDITIHGVTKEITLDGEFNGTAKDPWGNNRVGFTASGVIHRGDFGLKWNKLLETGGMVVGEDVKLSVEVEGIEKKQGAPAAH